MTQHFLFSTLVNTLETRNVWNVEKEYGRLLIASVKCFQYAYITKTFSSESDVSAKCLFCVTRQFHIKMLHK